MDTILIGNGEGQWVISGRRNDFLEKKGERKTYEKINDFLPR